MSEEGVHRPPVGGIAGTAKDGCQSIVLAGGYEDDEDNGDYFTYTGSGGRDLSGNKRTAEQSSDQKLDKSNAAIAMNCKVSFNPKDGGDAGDKWGLQTLLWRSPHSQVLQEGSGLWWSQGRPGLWRQPYNPRTVL